MIMRNETGTEHGTKDCPGGLRSWEYTLMRIEVMGRENYVHRYEMHQNEL